MFLDSYLEIIREMRSELESDNINGKDTHETVSRIALQIAGSVFFRLAEGPPDKPGKSGDRKDRHYTDIIFSCPLSLDEFNRDEQFEGLDPSVLGTLCEDLLRECDESATHRFSGVFYTCKTEIHLMCRSALADHLTNHLGEEHRECLIDAIFAHDPSRIQKADDAVESAGLWPKISDRLSKMTVLDPSSGSGSFLVGMLYIIDDLQHRANSRLGKKENSFVRRKRIVERNLWGFEIDELACDAAWMRLMLACVADAGRAEPEYYNDLKFNIINSDFLTGTAGMKFDIVIGNPPYVRQEKITDPASRLPGREYKKRIARSVYSGLPSFFGPDPDKPSLKLDARSDLYIYFFFAGIAHLDSHGTLCFITSNSWLDSGYGKTLREFLSNRCHVRQIIDSEQKRSFPSADINTVISLISHPSGTPGNCLDRTTRFVTFSEPLESISGDVFNDIESTVEWKKTEACRVRPVVQRDLTETGTDRAKFTFGNWGGRYLRSPDIFWVILKKSGDRLVRLSDVANVRRGITTGANDFFHLTDDDIRYWNIEPGYIKPLIKSSREIRSPRHRDTSTRYKIFICNRDRESLDGSAALEYIKWGEREGYGKRSTCASRKNWWSLGERTPPAIISPCSTHDLYRVSLNLSGSLVDKRLYEAHPKSTDPDRLAVCLNCSLTSLLLELGTRTGLGEGLLDMTVYEVANCPIVDPDLLEEVSMFDREIMGFEKELVDPKRRELDRVIFDALDLTDGEIEDFYEALTDMIKRRLKKARKL